MKRIIILILACVLFMSLIGCKAEPREICIAQTNTCGYSDDVRVELMRGSVYYQDNQRFCCIEFPNDGLLCEKLKGDKNISMH